MESVARIAVYDSMLAAPRIVDIQPDEINSYIGKIASTTYELASSQGGSIPYNVILQVSENLIHAHFKEPTISIMDKGNTIRFADHGPGIKDKERAQLPGFSSATAEMRQYINGVGSGLPIVKEFLKFSNGHLEIEDNIDEGTVVTVTIDNDNPSREPVVYAEAPMVSKDSSSSVDLDSLDISEREIDVLELAAELPMIGPTEIKNKLGLSVSTAYRVLNSLVDKGLLEKTTGSDKKRVLTDLGHRFLGR